MNKNNSSSRGCFAAVIASVLMAAPGLAQNANPWDFLPARVLEIEGGLVAFRGAVILDNSAAAIGMFAKYPTKYLLPVTNESAAPIWVDVEWRVPGEEPFKSSGKFAPGEANYFFVKTNVKTKEIAWNQPIPVHVAIYADAGKTRKLGGRDVVLFFGEGPHKDAFVKIAKAANSVVQRAGDSMTNDRQTPLLGGFQEMQESGAVPGTGVDDALNHDIRLRLWREESRHRWDCKHEILGAASVDPQGSKEIAAVPEDQRNAVEAGIARGEVKFETWQIKSCDVTTTYLLVMIKSPQGGTDFMAIPLAPAAPQ